MYERIVVKVGTSVLTGGTPSLDSPTILGLVRQCADLHAAGREIILVSSGAIAAGRQRLEFPTLEPSMANKQMLAAVGQSHLMQIWETFFQIYSVHVGQMLLTGEDIESPDRFANARDALQALLANRIIPVINENDAVATAEIKVGDNDVLSSLVVKLSRADLLILLTDQEGLYSGDPRSDPDAVLIPEVVEISDELRASAGDSVSGLGTGGMATKLKAAEIASEAGANVVIASGSKQDVITRIAAGEAEGTLFRRQTT